MGTSTVTERRTPDETWAAALERALAEALDALELVGAEDAWAVESGSRPGVAYLVTERGARCTCPVGERGLVCKHRACVRAALGELAPVVVALAACPECRGERGRREWDGRGGLDSWVWVRCRSCDGAGVVEPVGAGAVVIGA